MTPDELLQDLRDIHVPETAGESAPVAFAFEPLLGLAILVFVVWFVARWRRRTWRRELAARLRDIGQDRDPAEQWREMLALLRQARKLTHVAPPPDCVYRPRDRIGSAEIEVLRRYLQDVARA